MCRVGERVTLSAVADSAAETADVCCDCREANATMSPANAGEPETRPLKLLRENVNKDRGKTDDAQERPVTGVNNNNNEVN